MLEGCMTTLKTSHVSFSVKVNTLQDKWRDIFIYLDINNDTLLDMTDVTLCEDNFIHLHNMTNQEVCKYMDGQGSSKLTFTENGWTF